MKSEPPMTGSEAGNGICIGRFQAALPSGLEVQGRSQSIYRVSVSSTPLTNQKFEDFWRQRVDRMKAGGHFQRTVDLDSTTKGAWLTEGEDGVRLEAARSFEDHALVTSLSGDDDREAVIQKLTGNVMAAYQPGGYAGFCLERGVIVSEPGDAESTSLLLKHQSIADFSIKFLTQTVKYPLPEERLSDAGELEQSVAGASVQRIFSRHRSVAEINGLEEGFSVSIPNEHPVVRFSWKCSGESFRADVPQITIIGIARQENQAELRTAWDAFLSSLHKFPMATRVRR